MDGRMRAHECRAPAPEETAEVAMPDAYYWKGRGAGRQSALRGDEHQRSERHRHDSDTSEVDRTRQDCGGGLG